MSVSSSSDSLVIVGGESPKKINEETKMEPRPPEMKSMYVVSNLRNRYARTVVTSKYDNPDTHAQEATFSIVLPDTAFIAGFVMEIKEKKYEAYVKEKEEAKQEYQQAVSSGRAAAHVAVSARDSNKFTVSVNVEPQSDVTFILTYEELLVRKHSKYEMVVNLHLGQLLADLGVDIHINETRPIINVETPALRSGNEISDKFTKNEYATISKDNNGVVHVSFHPTIEHQKEMTKALSDTGTSKELPKVTESNGISGQFVVEYDVERDPLGGEVLVNDGYFVHFFAPSELKPIPKHIIFVLDVSGSMAGRKLKQVKEAMNVILNELNPEDYFNLVKFSDDISVLNSKHSWNKIDIPAESKLPQSFSVNEKNIKSVQTIVSKLTDEGSTNIYDALIVGLRLTSKGISHLNDTGDTDNKHKPQPIVVFLTDGQPNESESDPKKIIEMVEKRNDCDNKSAIFTLAFGDDADKDFLKELGIQNSGFLRNIYEAADASLQLQDFYKQISSPLLTNINFKYSEEVKEVTKNKFDILFDGSEFVVAGQVNDLVDGFVFVEGSTLDGTNKFSPTFITVCPNPDVKKEYGSLERLWAYMTIKQLLEKKYEKEANKDTNEEITEKEAAEKHALQLALKYSFVTPVTSLVVVRPDEPAVEGIVQDSNCNKNDFQFMDSDVHHISNLRSIADDQLRGLPSYSYCSFASNDCYNPETEEHLQFKSASRLVPAMKQYRKSRSSISDTIGQFFSMKPKETKPRIKLILKSIQAVCNVKNNVARTLEKRTYVNLDNIPQEATFTIDLPDKTILTEFVMETEGNIFESNKRDKKHAKKDYKAAVSSGVDAALVNLQDSTKLTVKVHLAPHSEVIFMMNYEKCLEKNDKKEIVINLYREVNTEEMTVNVNLTEATTIKNVKTPFLRFQNTVIDVDNELTTINRINDNEVQIEFNATAEQQAQIVNALTGTFEDFSGQYNVEYNIEPPTEAVGDLVVNTPTPIPSSYLVAIRR